MTFGVKGGSLSISLWGDPGTLDEKYLREIKDIIGGSWQPGREGACLNLKSYQSIVDFVQVIAPWGVERAEELDDIICFIKDRAARESNPFHYLYLAEVRDNYPRQGRKKKRVYKGREEGAPPLGTP